MLSPQVISILLVYFITPAVPPQPKGQKKTERKREKPPLPGRGFSEVTLSLILFGNITDQKY